MRAINERQETENCKLGFTTYDYSTFSPRMHNT